METKLSFDNRRRTLLLSGKTHFLHSSNAELKIRHILDTKTADVEVFGSLLKHMSIGDISSVRKGFDSRLRLSAGIDFASSKADTILVLKAKKQFRIAETRKVSRGRDYLDNATDIRLKARYDYNLQADSWSGDAFAALSHASFKLHDNMDFRLSLGVKGRMNRGQVSQLQPVLKIEENCWSFTTDCKGTWCVNYLL